MKRVWSKQEEQDLEQWIADGQSLKAIAEQLGRTYASVSQKTYVMGLPRRAFYIDQWDINMAHALRAEGLTHPAIAEKLELNRRQVDYIIYHKKPDANHAAV